MFSNVLHLFFCSKMFFVFKRLSFSKGKFCLLYANLISPVQIDLGNSGVTNVEVGEFLINMRIRIRRLWKRCRNNSCSLIGQKCGQSAPIGQNCDHALELIAYWSDLWSWAWTHRRLASNGIMCILWSAIGQYWSMYSNLVSIIRYWLLLGSLVSYDLLLVSIDVINYRWSVLWSRMSYDLLLVSIHVPWSQSFIRYWSVLGSRVSYHP